MRVLFLAHRMPYPPDKGDKIRSFWELKWLAARHEVDLFCFYDDPGDAKYLPELQRFCRNCYAEPLSWTKSRLRALAALSSGRPFTLGYFHSPQMGREVARAVRTRSYDLAFVFCSSMAQYIQSLSDMPRILDMVDVDSDKWAQYGAQSSSPLAWLWRLEAKRLAAYEREVASAFASTLVCTGAEADVLRNIAQSGNISVVEHPADYTAFDPESTPVPQTIRALQPFVVFTGQMDYRPNVDAVAYFCREIFPRLRVAHPELKFVIVGRNPAPEVCALEADPAVRVTGTVADLRPFLRGARAAVAPMRIARGVQNKILEAMAMGLPVVASRRAAAALPGPLAELVAAEDDPTRFAEALSNLLSGTQPPVPSIRQALLEHNARLNPEEKFEALIREAVRERSARGEEPVLSGSQTVTAGSH
ncbi:MAG TPA: TIGR03087 family PEP-CTERM/XrtA system glycosyltransferase [Terriglobia bacterium]|jgi:sugar transferase (PEP-CTERM/EpsH1 system associated)